MKESEYRWEGKKGQVLVAFKLRHHFASIFRVHTATHISGAPTAVASSVRRRYGSPIPTPMTSIWFSIVQRTFALSKFSSNGYV